MVLATCLNVFNYRICLAFSDLSQAPWAEQEINSLQALGKLSGYPDGSFRPNALVTRAEFAKLLAEIDGSAEAARTLQGKGTVFADVGKGHWANGYIMAEWENGVLKGRENGRFAPESPIRRDEAVVSLVRSLREGLEAGEEYSHLTPSDLPFTDRLKVPLWAVPEIGIALYHGLINGFADGTFRPDGYLTRAEMAALVYRALPQPVEGREFQGTLRAVYPSTKKVVVEVNQNKYLLDYPALPDELPKTKLPAPAAFDLNSQGIITGLDLVRGGSEQLQVQVADLDPQTHALINKNIADRLLSEGAQESKATTDLAYREPKVIARTNINPELSLRVTKEEIGGFELFQETGADGQGEIIAVIDTGVDVSHPDLAVTPLGQPKVRQWVDFTDEGRLETRGTARKTHNYLATREGTVFLGEIESRSGSFHYGVIKESEFGLRKKDISDLNFDMDRTDKYFVLVLDSESPGVYDTVIVDTNGNLDLTDDTPLKKYNSKPAYATFQSEVYAKFSFVVADLDPQGNWFKLGFDGVGHGTHVSGIIAANGKIKGIAPGAELIVLKAVEINGRADWEAVKNAVQYALEQGARIINLSLGSTTNGNKYANELSRIITAAAKDKRALFVAAAGNDGPGLSTVTSPGSIDGVICVGACITPGMWKTDYGWESPEGMWFFSSTGPRADGLMLPHLSAPGSAISTAPRWDVEFYSLYEGTSMAAPHVSAAAALLFDAARREGLEVGVEQVQQALLDGARSVPGLKENEVGRGILNVNQSWTVMKQMVQHQPSGEEKAELSSEGSFSSFGKGLLAREFLPGIVNFLVRNLSEKSAFVSWLTDQPWAKVLVPNMEIPAKSSREVPVWFKNAPTSSGGLESVKITGINPLSGTPLLEMSATVCYPEFYSSDGKSFEKTGRLPAGQIERYYVRVPDGTDTLRVSLQIAKNSNQKFEGRARLHLYAPNARETGISEYAGLSPDGTPEKEKVEIAVDKPEPGTWEIVVYSSATLSLYDCQESSYQIKVDVTQENQGFLLLNRQEKADKRFLVGISRSNNLFVNYYNLSLRSTVDYKPQDGLVLVNGRLYSVRKGKTLLFLTEEEVRQPVVINVLSAVNSP